MGDLEFSYGLPLAYKIFYKVNKVGVYPMNGVHQIHNKSREINPNNSNVCNIYFPKILVRVIKYRVDRTHMDTSNHVLPLSIR